MADYQIGQEYDCDERRYMRRSVECKHCGKAGLHWSEDESSGEFVLMEGVYKVHRCDEKKLHAQTLNDFDIC